MKTQTPTAKKKIDDKLQRLKLMLLDGKFLTVRYMDRVFKVNNSPDLILRLRKEMKVSMKWAVNEEGVRYGIYFYERPKKVNRITAGTYSRA